MTEEEEFDKTVRRKFAEKEFVFNEANWEKAEERIDSARRSNRILRWTAIFMIGLGSGIAIMLPFVGDKNLHLVAIVPSNVKIGNEIAELRKQEYANTGLQKRLSNENQNQKQTVYSTVKGIISGGKVKQETSVASSAAPLISSNHASIYRKANSSGALKKAEESMEENISETKNLTLQATPNSGPEKDKSIVDKITESKAEITVQQTETKVDNVSEMGETSNRAGQESIAGVMIKDSVASGKDQQSDIVLHSDPLAVVSKNSSSETESFSGIASTTIVSFEAGAIFNMGWSYQDTIEGRGFSPLAGIGLMHSFNPSWAISAGIQYGSIAGLNASRKIYSDTKYDFGYSATYTTIETKSLYYAILPVQLQYNFNDKNSMGFGGSISYLFNTKSNVIVYSGNNFGESYIKTEKQFGYVDGFNPWDISLSVSFRRKISHRIALYAQANYGLLDIKSDSFFSRQKRERNIGVKAAITYDLFQY